MKNLIVRIFTGLILAPLVIWVVILGGQPLVAMLAVASLLMYVEWCQITHSSKFRLLWAIGGIYYVAFPALVLYNLSLYYEPMFGIRKMPVVLLAVIFIVWLTDIGGMLFGKTMGGPKIAPKISPNKTWTGLLGGVILSLVFFLLQNIFEPFRSLYTDDRFFGKCVIIYTLLPVVAQIGDFFESWVKRRFGKKDSGSIIPGHGGLLDRLDGLLFVAHVIGIWAIIRYIMLH